MSGKRARLVKWAKREWQKIRSLEDKCRFAKQHNLHNWNGRSPQRVEDAIRGGVPRFLDYDTATRGSDE